MILSAEIIKEWNLVTLPVNKREEVVNKIGRILYQAVLVRTLEILSPEEQDELDDLMDKDTTTPKEVLLFLKKKIPTFETLLKEERENLRRDILI